MLGMMGASLARVGGSPMNPLTSSRTTAPLMLAGALFLALAVPPAQAGSNPGRARAGAVAVPPTITGLNPTSGPEQGGQCTVISGTDFQPGATVTFGSSQGIVDFPVQSTEVAADTPPGIGTVDVTVTNPDGGTATDPGAYMYS